MKIITPKEMHSIEKKAYDSGCDEEDFMEKAGLGIFQHIINFTESNELEKNVILLAGKGNNTSDGYAAASSLLKKGFSVTSFQCVPIETCSKLCQKKYDRFIKTGGKVVTENFSFPKKGLILDGLFGTGFQGSPKEPFGSLIEQANASKLPILAIDIPSGLNGETGKVEGPAIRATQTIFLGLPKLGFFLNEGWNFVGELFYVDFDLPKKNITDFQESFQLLFTIDDLPILPPMQRNRHKYQAGFVAGIGGSPGMPGAAILSAWAALKSGSGIVHLLYPEGMELEFASSPLEIIRHSFNYDDLDDLKKKIEKPSALFIGPGLGRKESVRKFIKAFLPLIHQPCVIDGDALTIMAQENVKPPRNSILTPHLGEARKLVNDTNQGPVDHKLIQKCQNYAIKNHVTFILKGGPTFIFHYEGVIGVNSTGDPGMATAGSGDVLTGLLASLLAQGLPPLESAKLGVFIHGVAGQYAAIEKTSYCMTASDIINTFPYAFSLFHQ